MKTKNFLILGLLCMFLASCSNDNDELGNTDGAAETKSVYVSLGGVSTRASDPSDFIADKAEGIVGGVHIYVTNAAGTIMASKNVEKNANNDSDWAKLVDGTRGLKLINVGKDASKVYVYGNPVATLAAPGGSIKTVNDTQIKLATQFNTNTILYAGLDENMTPVVPEPIEPDPTFGYTYSATVTISPVISRIQVTKMSFKAAGSVEVKKMVGTIEKKATVTWTGFGGDLVGLYLNNFHNYATADNKVAYTGAELFVNTTYVNHILDGKWLFGAQNADAAAYASYIKYEGGAYKPMALVPAAGKCYGFNLFPGGALPRIHLDLDNLTYGTLTSTDPGVFNPELKGDLRFLNIVKYIDGGNKEMTAADFKPGNIYDMEVEIMPAFLSDDISLNQYNIKVVVKVSQWKSNTVKPGFEGQ